MVIILSDSWMQILARVLTDPYSGWEMWRAWQLHVMTASCLDTIPSKSDPKSPTKAESKHFCGDDFLHHVDIWQVVAYVFTPGCGDDVFAECRVTPDTRPGKHRQYPANKEAAPDLIITDAPGNKSI